MSTKLNKAIEKRRKFVLFSFSVYILVDIYIMEGIYSTLIGLTVFLISLLMNMKMKKRIIDLEKRMNDNEKINSLKIEELKKAVETNSGSILDESKAHLDAALLVLSKRIGKREKI